MLSVPCGRTVRREVMWEGECERERESVSEKASVWDRNGREITSEAWIVRSRAIYLFSSCDTIHTQTQSHTLTHTHLHTLAYLFLSFVIGHGEYSFMILMRILYPAERSNDSLVSLSLSLCLSPSLSISALGYLLFLGFLFLLFFFCCCCHVYCCFRLRLIHNRPVPFPAPATAPAPVTVPAPVLLFNKYLTGFGISLGWLVGWFFIWDYPRNCHNTW